MYTTVDLATVESQNGYLHNSTFMAYCDLIHQCSTIKEQSNKKSNVFSFSDIIGFLSKGNLTSTKSVL